MGMNTDAVQRLYVAYFNRPADPVSLSVYESLLPTDTVATQAELQALAETYFSPSAEYTSLYAGMSNTQIVNQLYQNIFGRQAEPTGLTYWAAELTKGTQTVASLALQLSYSAQGTDAQVVANRIEAANAFTNGLDTTAEITGYSGNAAAASARSWLATVGSDAASKDAAIAGVDAAITAAVDAGNAVAGSSYTLTTNADTGAAFTGTAGNDTFVSTASTLTTGDDLNGGTGGTDVLTYTADLTASSSEGGFTLTNFDEMAFNLTDGAAGAQHTLTVNALNAGAINFKVSGSTAANANDDIVSLTNVAKGATLEMNNSTNFNLTADYVAAATAGTADAVTLTVNGMASAANTGVVTIGTGGGTGFETVNIVSTGSASTIGSLVSGATTINASGSANLTVTADIENTTDVLNASGLTGNLKVTLANAGGERPDGDALNDLADLTVTGGSGNDTINGASLATGTLEYAIDGGAGNDTITIGATPDNATATNVGDVYAGGEGTGDVLVADVDLVDAVAITVARTGVSGFETLSLNGFAAGADTVTPANIQADLATVAISTATFADLTIAFGSGTYNVSIGPTNATLDDDTLTVTSSGTATTDVLNISNGNLATGTNQIGANDTAIVTTGFETVNFNTGSYSTATAQNVNTVNIGATGTLNLSGSNGLSAAGAITAKTIDASSMTGALVMAVAASTGLTTLSGGSGADTLRGDEASTINGNDGADQIFGGNGNDVLNGGSGNDTITADTGSDTINGGLGDDTIAMGANLTALDVIDGGDGTDTLSVANGSLTALQAMTLSEANAFNAAFTSVETLTIADGLDSTNDNFDLGRLDGISTVNIGTIANDAETLSGFDSGDTLNITKSTTNDLTIGVNSAVTGATDVINIGLTAAGNSDANTLSIANVETVNITAAESPANATVRQHTLGLSLTQTAVSGGGSGAAQTVNILGTENVIFDTTIAAGTINASGMTVAAATQAGLTMDNALFTATTVITGQTVTGSGGVDVLYGSTGADTINGGAGNDNIHAGAGSDTIDGGAGTGDTFHTTGMVGATIEGAATGTSVGVVINLSTTAITDNTINNATGDFLGGGATAVAAGTVMYTFDTASDLFASTADTITNVENVTLAGNGVNYVQMNDSANVVVGGTGIDTIIAGGGIDTITGGVGADVINLTETTSAVDTLVRNGDGSTDGTDTVTGFAGGTDVIDFTTNGALEGGVAKTGYGTGALGNIATGDGLQVYSTNITTANNATVTAAEMETYLGATEVFFNGATNDSVYLVMDNGVNTFVVKITEGADGGGANKQFDVAQDTFALIMVLTGVTDATTLTAASFADFAA